MAILLSKSISITRSRKAEATLCLLYLPAIDKVNEKESFAASSDITITHITALLDDHGIFYAHQTAQAHH